MSRTSSRRVRYLLAPDGAEWTVFELSAAGPRGRTLHLVFDGEAAVRRLREFPANWYELSDDELAALGECV